ncbi:hypothetical protein L211DRAFT_834172 [Terfezia boudieri ATCC MYA-4762]|uniref:H-type lectin domain-containing protein n=1 Tax=Terfezia boudieri ATCC MYA-4762 TaxID=1051890 RepID=A0A3N4LWT1_9PEZI|nr:hypothetical protein L211DRAFT_834172 [Terfezia boudieri ATCC MYA-4762]
MSTGQELSLSLKIDSGSWNTAEVRDYRDPVVHTEGRVKFSNKFTSLPTVIVSLLSADVSNEYNFRVNVYATDVNLEGFTVHVNSWADTKIYSCGVSWLAIGH